MNGRLIVILGVVLGCLIPAVRRAQPAEAAIPAALLVQCPRVQTAPAIDGRLDEEAWRGAAEVTNFFQPGGEGPAAEQTCVYLAYDDEALYLGFRCHLSSGRAPVARKIRPNDDIYTDDSVEVFLAVDRDRPRYLHFIANSSGVRQTEQWTAPGVRVAGWDPTWRAGASVDENDWVAELAIPFASIGRSPRPGDRWGLNLNRNIAATEETGWQPASSSWSCTFGGFHRPERFGTIVFGPPGGGLGVEILDPGILRPGAHVYRASLENRSRTRRQIRAAIGVRGGAGQTVDSCVDLDLEPGEKKDVAVDYAITDPARRALVFAVTESVSDRLFYQATYSFAVPDLNRPLEELRTGLTRDRARLKEVSSRAGDDRRRADRISDLAGAIETALAGVAALEARWRSDEALPTRWAAVDEGVRKAAETAAGLHDRVENLNDRVLVDSIKDAGARRKIPYVLYTVDDPFTVCGPSALPAVEKIGAKISAFGCPGEYEPATFLIFTLEELKSVMVEVTDLRCDTGRIPRGNVDVRVVNCWYQAGQGSFIEESADGTPRKYLVPELLLKDDGLFRVDPVKQINVCNFQGNLAPESRELKPVAVPRETSKQFWLTIKIPEGTSPGLYQGTILVRPENAPPREAALEVEVLPINLPRPDKVYGIDIGFHLAPGQGWNHPSREMYERYLQDMVEHGLNSTQILDRIRLVRTDGREVVGYGPLLAKEGISAASVYAGLRDKTIRLDFTYLQEALECQRRAGLTSAAVFVGLSQTPVVTPLFHLDIWNGLDDESRARTEDIFLYLVGETNRFVRENGCPSLIYYGLDEPFGQRADQCARVFRLIHQAGGRTTSAVAPEIRDQMGRLIDVARYAFPAGFPIEERVAKDETMGCESWFYPNDICVMENALNARLRTGFWFWKTGLRGCYPWVYQHQYGDNPYDDWDITVNYARQWRRDSRYRRAGVIYPSLAGPIPTLNWEGYREGIDDVRYLTALTGLLAQVRKKPGNQVIQEEADKTDSLLKEILAQINTREYDSRVTLKFLKARDLHDFRRRIADEIIRLQKVVK